MVLLQSGKYVIGVVYLIQLNSFQSYCQEAGNALGSR